MRKLLLISILSLIATALSAPLHAKEKTDEYKFADKGDISPITSADLPVGWNVYSGSLPYSFPGGTSYDFSPDESTSFSYFKISSNGLGFVPEKASKYSFLIIPVQQGKINLTFYKQGTPTANVYIIKLKNTDAGKINMEAQIQSFTYNNYATGDRSENVDIDFSGYIAIATSYTNNNLQSLSLKYFSNTYKVSEESTYTLTGTVRSYDNLVMCGIDVKLLEGADTRTVQTDAEGTFTFDKVFTNMPTITINQNGYMPYSHPIPDVTPTYGVYNWGTIELKRLISKLYLTVDGSGNKYDHTDIENNYTADFYGAVFSLYKVTESYNPDDDADKSTLKSFISADNFIDSITFDEDNRRFKFDILDAVNSNGYVLTCSPDDYEYNTFEPIFIPVYDAAQASIDTPYIIQYTETTNEFNLFKYFRPKTFTITGGIYEWDGDLVINDKAYFTLIRHDRVYDSNGEFTYSDTGLPSIPITQDNGIFTYIGDVRAANYFKYDVLCGVAEDLHPGEKWYCDDLEDYNFEGRDITLRGLAYKAGSYSLDSTVVNEWGVPVAHAKVEVFNAGSKCGHSCITDGNGNFHIIYADPDPDPNPDPDETTPSSAPAFAPTVFEDGAEIDPDFKSDDPKQQGYYVKITPENDLYKTTVLDFDPNKSEINIKENGNTVVGNTKSLATTFRMDSGTITGIENVAEEDNAADRVTVNGRDICVAGNANVEVFTIAGSRCGLTNLPAGIYIVRVDGRSYKLLIP